MEIIWSEEAAEDYYQNIGYLLESWSEKSAMNFINEVDSVLEIIKERPEVYPLSGYRSVRKAVIRKQITLFYKVEGTRVYLVRFWNNYQDPESMKL
ncbi:MAG: type II toxin-antitoxin system RelE/ParE family toxin [Cytophagales bacterium]|nr:type II toxin-antitoxin system RelE/ParE family toxin [Cytophagales bacterium]